MPTAYEVFELDGVEVKLSNPDKVYFPDCGVTKGELAQRRGQHPARHAVDLPQQLVEPPAAARQPREHDDAPLGGEHADGGLQRLQRLVVRRPQRDGLSGACHGDRW